MTNETNKQKMHPYSQALQWVSEGKEIECHQAFNSEWRPTDYDTVLSCAIHGVKSGSYLQPQDFRLKSQRHIHQDLIDAFENGAEIEQFSVNQWRPVYHPLWSKDSEYRIKPKPDVTLYGRLYLNDEENDIGEMATTPEQWSFDNLKVVFCGDTKKLKSVEII